MKFKKMKLIIMSEFIIIYIFIIISLSHLVILTETINKLIIFKDNNVNVKYSSVNYI